ncbi:MAG: hypothetical protein JW781_08045 [Deltaproteobacteria bacterium]|nr:hypothetical protein [Candidatus Anaeroferrophillacea bacterium]
MMKFGRPAFFLAAILLLTAELILFRHTLIYHARGNQPTNLNTAAVVLAADADMFVTLTGTVEGPPLAVTSRSNRAAVFILREIPHIAVFDLGGMREEPSGSSSRSYRGRLVPVSRSPFSREIATHFNGAQATVSHVLLAGVVPDHRIMALFVGVLAAIILLLIAAIRLQRQGEKNLDRQHIVL